MVLATSFLTALPALAGPGHKAHVHGAGQLQIAFEGSEGRLEFVAEASAILGFEHAPKTDKQKTTLSEAVRRFRESLPSMIQWDSGLGCTWSPEQVEQVMDPKDPKHSDFVAKFKGLCLQSPKGTRVRLDFREFPRLKSLKVEVLVDELQKSMTYSGKPINLELR